MGRRCYLGREWLCMETTQAIERFLNSPALGEGTRRSYRHDVEEFADWLQRRNLSVGEVDVRVLTDYAAELGRARPRKLAPATIARKVAAIRSFLRFTLGPTNVPDISLAPRRPKLLPDTPKTAEVEAALDALMGDGPLPLRNRALVELVYSAGLRSAEAVGLDLADVDFDREQLHVRGKGGKERIVPLGEQAGQLVAQYLHDARPQLAAGAENALFLSARGRRLDTSTLRRGVTRPATPRHSVPTQTLEGGAALRPLQN